MIFRRDKFKIKIGGCKFYFRKLQVSDLLGTDFFPPIFLTPEKKSDDIIDQIIEEKENEDSEEGAAEKFFKYQQHIVSRCYIEKRGLTTRTLIGLMRDESFVQLCYVAIMAKTINRIEYISKVKAENIYFIYKGMNFAKEYFGDSNISKIEEFAFNVHIYNSGVSKENRMNKEAERKARARRG